MISWILRVLLVVAGSIAGLFLARDAANFVVVQAMVGLLIIALIMFVLVFWPARWTLPKSLEQELRRLKALMSALGQKQTCAVQKAMSALPPITTEKADILPL